MRNSRMHITAGVATLAVLASALGGGVAVAAPAVTTAASAPAAAADAPLEQSTVDEKMAAADAVGITLTPSTFSMNDTNFVLALWRKAEEGSEVKNAALAAFGSEDSYAPTRFIKTGIYQAYALDLKRIAAREKERKARMEARQSAVAQVPGWKPAADIYDVSDKDFVFAVWQNAKDGSQVKAGAAAVLRPENATPEALLKFIITDIKTLRDLDRQKEIADAEEQKRKEAEAKANKEAREAAAPAALNVPADASMLAMSDRDFADLIYRKTEGTEVRLAARAALDSTDPKAVHDFIFTGVHAAHQRDIDIANAKDREAKLRQVQEILDNAQRDGFQPNLVAAAKEALKNPTLTVLTEFLAKGQHEAAKLDFAKPKEGMVIELKGLQSGRCLQTAGYWDQPHQGANANGAGTELWDCVTGIKQRWVLHDRGGKYQLENVSSLRCLTVGGSVNNNDMLVQWDCDPADTAQLWEFVPVGDNGMFELRNVKSGKAASVLNGGTENAALVVQYTNTHASNQAWRLVDVNHNSRTLEMPTGEVYLKGLQSTRCLQMAGYWDQPNQGANANGAAAELWDCIGGAVKERWVLADAGDHKYTLKSVNSGKCLDVSGSRAVNGTPVVQWDCHGGANQQWVFYAGRNGAVKMVSAQTGGAVTVLNAATHNGALVQQFADSNGDEQLWTLLPKL
ncbi:Short repeat-containing protein of unknown function [Amycolatopsis xylanica]|uniref:Ricin B lectin domain-containing protein n=1 Tax=Amycolatopsis xylanica TaxID=589385 RepID=A0A1H3Q154_9PSEU|nr:RICIN domain-containing protein [Amycolatopsis xylanica]SDZ06858.1 Short repeat-containing protein of unknown function [Amycolatopsis xylanica]